MDESQAGLCGSENSALRGEGMKTIQEQLIEKGLVQPVKRDIKQKDTETSKKRNERLSERELAELMGINRQTYRRGPSGAIRRR